MKEVLIVGDLLPTPSNYDLFEAGDTNRLLGSKLNDIFRNKEVYTIVNLEGPLTNSVNSIDKSGPNLKGTESSINGIIQMNINCCSLANNHIMDYGIEGLQSTIRILNENEIGFVGVGNTKEEAQKPYILSLNEHKVGIYSCAEYEFTIATDYIGGANPFDSLEIADHIERLKKQVDYLIVLYHGGKEHYRYPVPYIQKRCRKMIEKGADLIICQHSHCVGCKEEYEEGTIVYGQGNFLFDRGESEFRNTGLLIKVNPISRFITYIPVVKQGNGVRLADDKEKQEVLKSFFERSEEIKEKEVIEKKYKEFALRMLQFYDLGSLGIIGRILEKVRMQKVAKRLFRRNDYLRIINNLRCEAHRDLYMEGISGRINEK